MNTDGGALSNPGRLGAGGILRDNHGRLVISFKHQWKKEQTTELKLRQPSLDLVGHLNLDIGT